MTKEMHRENSLQAIVALKLCRFTDKCKHITIK